MAAESVLVEYRRRVLERFGPRGRADTYDARGLRDLNLQDNVRSYLFAGAQHSPAAFPPAQGAGQQAGNPVDYWWSLRALLVAMDRWVREGESPPPSTYPRIDRGT